MGQHEKSRARQRRNLADWLPPVGDLKRYRIADRLLDSYLDGEQRASEWDADHWGLPDSSTSQLEPVARTAPECGRDPSWSEGLAELLRRAHLVNDGRMHGDIYEPGKWEL